MTAAEPSTPMNQRTTERRKGAREIIRGIVMTILRTAQLLVAAAFFLCMTRTYAAADPRSEYRLEVAPQLLTQALKEFAHQTKLQVVYYTDVAEGLSSPGATGARTLEDALKRLLAGTGLEYVFLNERTIAIRQRGGDARKGDKQKTSGAYPWADDLGVGRDGRRDTTSLAQNATTDAATDESRSQSSAQQDLPRPEESGKAIPEMLVKGRRSINADIQRTEDDTQPYVVFDRRQIERSMANSVDEFLKTRLPMNSQQESSAQGGQPVNNSQINLRGLGTNQTLILVDGRRMPDWSTAGSFIQPDINGIPLSAIERIEVLPSTASGIYGGGATGGVINITTRKDYAGLDVGLTYGNVFEADADTRRVDIGAGFTVSKTRAMFSLSHSESDPLLMRDRDFIDRSRALQQANNLNAFLTGFQPPFGATTNIRSQNNSNLVLDDGTALNSPRTFVPIGYAGPASDGGAALVANAGLFNLQPPNDITGYDRSLINNPTVSSVSLGLRREIGDRIEAFVDGSWLHNEGRSRQLGVVNSATIPADAPNNPFTTPISVTFPVPNASFEATGVSETVRGLGGIIVRLPADWIVAAEYSWSRSRNDTERTALTGDPDGPGPAVSVTTALTDGTLDVLRDVNAFPLDYSPYFLDSPNEFATYDTTLKNATLRFSGPVFALPAGPITVSAALEHREQELGDTFWTFTSGTRRFFPGRTQTVQSSYLETRVPVFSADYSLPFLSDLELLASVRLDDYKTETPSFNGGLPTAIDLPPGAPIPAYSYITNSSDAAKHTLGLRYSPVPGVMLRASVGTGFMAPGLTQLAPLPPSPTTATVIDPKRGSVSTTYSITSSRQFNPDLMPEESKSWSAGMILSPRWLRGARLSIDYTEIRKEGEITFFNFQNLVNLEDFLPAGRVVRDELTDADRALGYTGGVITALDTSFVNLSATQVEAWDIQADYILESAAGDFSFYAIATWQPNFERQASPLAPVFNSVGFSSGQLEWRGNAGLAWSRGPWMIGWDTQYYDDYRVYSATSSAAGIATAVLNQGAERIPRQVYHDVFASYRVIGAQNGALSLLDNVEFKLGIQNVLDESPPILASTSTFGPAYSTYGDARLRRYTLSLRKSF